MAWGYKISFQISETMLLSTMVPKWIQNTVEQTSYPKTVNIIIEAIQYNLEKLEPKYRILNKQM